MGSERNGEYTVHSKHIEKGERNILKNFFFAKNSHTQKESQLHNTEAEFLDEILLDIHS